MRRCTRAIARSRSSATSSRRSRTCAIAARACCSRRITRCDPAAMPRVPVTAILHTLNEIENIDDCLRSVEWADEIYLIDTHSTDGTVERIRTHFPHVRLEQREYLGAASTKNYAIDRATHDWIFVIDADERVTPKLRDELLG